MKWNFLSALVLTTTMSGAAFAYDYGYEHHEHEIIERGNHHRDHLYSFHCVANAVVHRGEEVITHVIEVDGNIDASRRTLGGKGVYVAVNDRGFAKYNLPQHSIWVKDGELLSLSLRGQTVKGEVFKFRYAGEGNVEQNRIELSKNRRTLSTNDISCELSKYPW
jgi:hypothetical protein